jgi:hypothetical protein
MKKGSVGDIQRIEALIYLIRGQKVMLDSDLADLYGVENRALKQAVRRNRNRFPSDFMFELTKEENRALRSQNVILEPGRYSKYLPFAFTEQGVAMLSTVLNSERGIEVNIAIMRVFVRLREMMATHKELALKLRELERRIQDHDEKIVAVFEAIRQLMTPPETARKKIGFEVKEQAGHYQRRKRKE